MNEQYFRDFTQGFLPLEDPLLRLPAAFDAWEEVGRALPKLNLSNYLRSTVDGLPPFPADLLQSTRELERAMTLLSFLANSYVFAPDQPVARQLPANLARGWVAVAKRLGRPPMLTYASHVLYNWRRIDPAGPLALGNLTLIQNFLSGMDEEWFTTVHINIEAAAGRGLAVLLPAQRAVAQDDATALEGYLSEIAATLQTLHDLLSRMPERCDPHIYYHRVRPWIFGWKDNPQLPGGMIYTGVPAFGDQPQQFRGETGAQSSVIYAFDAVLGIDHEFDAMRAYLMEMRDYMPVQDRAFIELLEQGPSARTYIAERKATRPSLRDTYNGCIEKLQQFRQLHIEYAALYIIKPAQGAQQGEVGTGGTPFTVYLKKHIQETKSHLLYCWERRHPGGNQAARMAALPGQGENMNSAESLYAAAQQVLPGGVTASFRVNRAIGRPFYVARGDGPYVYDLDGKQYVDMCMSHGASLLGHNHPQLKAAIAQALEMGIICSYENEHQTALAQRICELVPCAEMVRFAGSGTETVMHALRLARTATGREKIIKFEGHFHGYSDALNYSVSPPLAAAGPVEAPRPYPESTGMPVHHGDALLIVPFNDVENLEIAFALHGKEVAALVMEPVNYDQGCILPQPGFVQRCRELCDRYGALLFFDEVLTAFRMAPGGAQEYLGVTPDLCVLGKALGAGMPISAIAGKRTVMQHLKPLGTSEMSGTYLAHLTSVLAADAALAAYSSPGFYERLDAVGEYFYSGLQAVIDRSGVPLRVQHLGPRFGLYFGVQEEVTNYRQAAQKNRVMELTFIKGCIERGVYFHPSPHHGFSAAHSEAEMDRVLAAAESALVQVKGEFSVIAQ